MYVYHIWNDPFIKVTLSNYKSYSYQQLKKKEKYIFFLSVEEWLAEPGRACPAAARWWRWKIANQRKTARVPSHVAVDIAALRAVCQKQKKFLSDLAIFDFSGWLSFIVSDSDELLTDTQMSPTIWQIDFGVSY